MAKADSLVFFTSELQRLLQIIIRNYEKCDRECVKQLDVTVSQAATIFCFPEEGSLTMRGLSELMGLAESTMTRTVDQLVAKELVQRELDNEDRRVVRVSLTGEGIRKRQALEQSLHEYFALWLGDLGEKDRQGILESLSKLVSAIEVFTRDNQCP